MVVFIIYEKDIKLTVVNCGKEHKTREADYVCGSCGGNLKLILTINLLKNVLTMMFLEHNTSYTVVLLTTPVLKSVTSTILIMMD